MPAFLKNAIAQNNAVLYTDDHWHFYLALINEKPAGIGVSFNKNGIVTLAAAATVPDLRNSGVQTALIQERLNQAKLQSSKLAVGQAKFASVSQNNMERAGMNIAYTRALWVKKITS